MTVTVQDQGKAFVEFVADGTVKAFEVPFPYLDRSHLQVIDQTSLASQALKVLNTDYTIDNEDPGGAVACSVAAGQKFAVITFGTAPSNGHVVRVERHTPETLYTKNPTVGHIMAIQAFYLAQEKADQYTPLPFVINAADLSGAVSAYVVAPFDCELKKLETIVTTAIVTGGAVTGKNGVGGTAIDGLSVTVADSSAVGDRDEDRPTDGHATTKFKKGGVMEILPAAAFNGGGALFGYAWVKRANPV